MARVQINLRCTESLVAAIDLAAQRAGLSRTEFMMEACRRAIDEPALLANGVRPGPARQTGPSPPPEPPLTTVVMGGRGLGKAASIDRERRKATSTARKRPQAPHSVATANRSAAGSKPLERRQVDPIPKAPKGKR